MYRVDSILESVIAHKKHHALPSQLCQKTSHTVQRQNRGSLSVHGAHSLGVCMLYKGLNNQLKIVGYFYIFSPFLI